MGKRVSVQITSDEVALIRAKMAYVGVQIAELKAAMESHQAHVREALLKLADGEADGS